MKTAYAMINVNYVERIELIEIEYGIEDYILYRWVGAYTEQRRARIRYTQMGEAYFLSDGRRYHFRDAIRIN